MFKPTAIIIAAAIAAGGAFAQELQKTLPAAPPAASTGIASASARAAAAGPAPEYTDARRSEPADAGSGKAKRRPRKEYPNVMGMTITEWLAIHHPESEDSAL